MHLAPLDARPVIVALAGPNGAGKTTFYHAHLRQTGLPFINADVLARELNLDPYAAARMAGVLRREFVARGASFVFETVFSDPVGDKLSFLRNTVRSGYTVVLCYIGISGPEVSEVRVAMRVSQGGHDVSTEKLRSRFPRTIENLRAAIRDLPHVLIYDNDDLAKPYRLVGVFEQGCRRALNEPVPTWLELLLA
jgi:predicted ABC-type ATPase